MWLSTLIVIAMASYVVAAPDKKTLTVSRGVVGAWKGLSRARHGQPVTGAGSSKSTTKKTPSVKYLARGMWDGWHEGVATARERRAEGKDLWSRGTKLAGRSFGAAENLYAGVRQAPRNLAQWRTRRNGQIAPGEVVLQPVPAEPAAPRPVPTEPRQGKPKQLACQHCFETVLRQYRETNRYREGLHPFDLRPIFAADIVNGVDGSQKCIGCGRSFAEIYRPAPAPAAAPAASAGPVLSVVPNTNTTTPSEPAEAETEKKETPMSINITEFESPEAVKSEAKAANGAAADVQEALEQLKKWGTGVPDRWSGAGWSTGAITAAVAEVADATSALGDVEPLITALQKLTAAVQEAQNVSEVLEQHDITGDAAKLRAS